VAPEAVLNRRPTTTPGPRRRLVAVRRGTAMWVVPADEVFNVQRLHSHEVQSLPLTVSSGVSSHARGVFDWRDVKAGYLVGDAIFDTLKRMVG